MPSALCPLPTPALSACSLGEVVLDRRNLHTTRCAVGPTLLAPGRLRFTGTVFLTLGRLGPHSRGAQEGCLEG